MESPCTDKCCYPPSNWEAGERIKVCSTTTLLEPLRNMGRPRTPQSQRHGLTKLTAPKTDWMATCIHCYERHVPTANHGKANVRRIFWSHATIHFSRWLSDRWRQLSRGEKHELLLRSWCRRPGAVARCPVYSRLLPDLFFFSFFQLHCKRHQKYHLPLTGSLPNVAGVRI